MLKHNLLFFFRSLNRYRLFATLNIGGLTLGMAAAIYMLDYIAFEQSYDDFRPDGDRIFRITSQKTQDGVAEPRRSSASVYLATYLKERFPEIEEVSRVHILDNARQTVLVGEGDLRRKFEETRGFHAGEDYFKIFSDQLLHGNPETAFDEPFKMVITESTALRYFGTTDAYGETVTLVDDEVHDYLITGVVKDVPLNSHFHYDYLISLKTLETLWPNARWTAWNWDYFHTYIKVLPWIDTEDLEKRINQSVADFGKEVFQAGNYHMDFQFQNIRDIHLQSNLGRELSTNGNGQLLGYLKIIALFVIVLAWVNYINLATATSSLRAKEIGIRKASGALYNGLLRQFLFESFLLNLIALIIALSLVTASTTYLESLTGHRFSFLIFQDANWLALLLVVMVIGSFFSGLYPAIVLSGLKTVQILKGSFKGSAKGIALRKSLVVFQFVISLILMTATIAIYQQVNFLKNRDLGIELEQVVVVGAPNIRTDQIWNEYDYLKNRALENSQVQMVSASNQIPGNVLYHTELFKRREQNVTEAKVAGMVWVDYDFMELYDLKLLAGKDFVKGDPDNERGMIINESSSRLLGFKSPEEAIGQPMTWVHSFGALTDLKIIGVVNDYDQRPLGTTQPMAMLMDRFYRWREMAYYLYRIQTVNAEQTIASIREYFEEVYPNETFSAFFLDEHFNKQYQSEARFGDIFSIFSLIAIIISSLGLFGLTYFILDQKKKEISIRKVLGASVHQLTGLVSRQLTLQMVIATALGIPLIYYLLDLWLRRFAYRMDTSIWLFILPGLGLLAIAVITSFWQTMRAAKSNPVKHLRNE